MSLKDYFPLIDVHRNGKASASVLDIIESDEFDLGLVDLIDLKLEQLRHRERQLAEAN